MCPHYEEKIKFDEYCACGDCRNLDVCWMYYRAELHNSFQTMRNKDESRTDK